jgi:hypothetical protein
MSGSLYAQAPNWPVERPPQPLPARDVKFPPYEIRTLQNGLQVVVVQHHEQPILTLRMLIRSGAASDPSQKQGVAVLTAALLDQGTTTRSAEQIADTIDSIGGGLGTGAGTDLSYANVLVMKDSLSLGFELLNDVVRNPAFKTDELERQRQQAISGLRVSYEDPDYVAGLVFDRLVYGFHPVRPAEQRHAGVAPVGHGGRPARVSQDALRAQQRDPRCCRRRDAAGGVFRRRARVRQLGVARRQGRRPRCTARAHTPRDRRGQARCLSRPSCASGSWRCRASTQTTWPTT